MKRPAASSVTRVARLDIEQLRQITRVARLHYMQGERQAVIADKLGISQASVSRLLSLAEDHGIVRTIVVPPEGLYPDVEDGLAAKFGLDAAYVVDISHREDGIAQVLGSAAARCLADELDRGPVLGFTSWSTTLREMARHVEPRAGSSVAHVVEMLGDLGSPRLQHEAALATTQMAKALDAEPVFLRTPGVMASAEQTRQAMADAHVRKAVQFLDKLDVAFVGIGPADFHGSLEEGDNFFSAAQLAHVRSLGAVGQLHQRFITAQGEAIETELDGLVAGITLSQLRKAQRRIAVAGGAAKQHAIAAALAGKWIHVLVTDINTANFLMSLPSKGTP